MLGATLAAAPAHAASAALTVNKTVDGVESGSYLPGDEFTYTITVGCDDADCVNARLTDALPAALAGFEILRYSVNPPSQPANASFAGCDTVVTENCVLTVDFLSPLDAGGIGIRAGDTYQISITLKTPQDLQPSWPANGVAVPNTAEATADTADPKADAADITVTIPTTVDVSVGKTWSPASQQFSPGVESTVGLEVSNASNVAATSLSLQDPKVADKGAASLDASNPFQIVDFIGFGAVTAPEGADLVTVDAYVYNAGSWTWVTGSATSIDQIALPAEIDPASVGGLRITFTDSTSGAEITPQGAAGAVQFTVAQRGTNRNDDAPLTLGASATNEVTGTVVVPEQDAVAKDASAPYEIAGLDVKVAAEKSINPARIPAGTSASATIGGKNNSNGPLTSLTLADEDYFTETLRFGGFSQPITYPQGATAATITWTSSDGSAVDIVVAEGELPTVPSSPAGEHLTGFSVTYTGNIVQGATVEVEFTISAAVGLVPEEDASPFNANNTVVVSGTNPAGTADAEASAPLDVFYPQINLAIDKMVSPAGAVTAGGTGVVQLKTTTGTDSAYVKPTEIVVEDSWRPAEDSDFWNAFTPTAIAPTQVLGGSTLTIEYTTDGENWQQLTIFAPAGDTEVFSGTIAELAPGLDVGTITGLRYTFADPEGFPAGVTVSPNTVYEARDSLRSDAGTGTSVPGEEPTVYENLGFANASGIVEGGTVVESDRVEDIANAGVISYTGNGTLMADKEWNPELLSSQSGETAHTELGWGVTATGYESVTIADPNGGEAAPENTVFQAFDLKRIEATSFANDPLLRWDTVSSIELFYNGAWNPVTPPDGSWINGAGFTGYTLSDAESAATTGVRIGVVPNDAVRASSTDPLTPPVGSGVAASAADESRPFTLEWRLRNIVRVPDANGQWASATHGYNDDEYTKEGDQPDPATIWNTVGVSGMRNGSAQGPREAKDNISLIDQPPAVSVTKDASASILPIPFEGDVPDEGYPTVDYTVTATNESASRASYIRVTDPMPCSDATLAECTSAANDWSADPFDGTDYVPATNPFENVTLTGVAFDLGGAGADKNASIVTVWKRAANGDLSTETLTITALEAYTPEQLLDVVGVSVLYQGVNPAETGGTISVGEDLRMTLHTQVRSHQRSEPDQVVQPQAIENYTFVQGYDPVLSPDETPNDNARAVTELVDGKLDVTAKKTITPSSLIEKDRENPVTVTLEATDGASTVATNEVTIEDTDAEFWSTFALVSLGTVSLPAGADQVRVDVQADGSGDWILGTASASAVLPAVDVASVTGIRFVFTRADGGVFSDTAPPAGWQASAGLTVSLLDAVRTTGEEIPFPSSVGNQIDTSSTRTDDPEIYAPAEAGAADDIALTTGTYRMDVEKKPHSNLHTVYPGEVVPWTLEFTNSGSGYLTVNELADQLPSHLSFDFEDPTYETSTDGTLSTDVVYAYDEAAKRIVFTWPAGGQRMLPGESFTITLGLILEPGLGVNDRASNQFVVTTGQELAACTNESGNGQGVMPGLTATQCGTTNFVQPIAGASLAVYKGVKGEIDGELVSGAVNVSNPAKDCITDAEGYYRTPCAANTVVGATDEWKLNVVNSGTESYSSMTLVEPLPTPGDRMLATGSERGSTYRPTFDGEFGISVAGAPESSALVWQVTTDADTCVGAVDSTWPADPQCSADTWVTSSDYTGEWDDVTGLRVQIDFSTTASGLLAPGQSVKLLFHTVNAPASEDGPDRAPIEVPVTGNYAWNQFGAVATLENGNTLQRAPVKAGVALVSGPLQVTKALAGDAAAYAAEEFLFDVSCTVAGAQLQLGADSVLQLNEAADLTARIDGIPLGADCTIIEQGDIGQFGESSRTGSPATVRILSTTGADDTVAAEQAITISNGYDYGNLSITKAVDTHATVGEFGPFGFALGCTTLLGEPVVLNAADAAFTLAAGATHTVTAGTIPAGAECVVEETDAGGADAVTFSGSTVVDSGDSSAIVTVGLEATAMTTTNTFDAGTLSVLKTVVGAGAADYGDGPFAASVTCTYGDQLVYANPSLAIVPDDAALVDAVFPVGTLCEIAEVLTGGATEEENPAAIVITGPEDGQIVGAVTASVTNRFYTGEIALVKERVGDGVEEFGAGPFDAQVSCTWQKNGETLTVPLIGGGLVVLSEENDYTARLDGIIVGAACSVVETDAGLATANWTSPENGIVTILDSEMVQEPATVVITNQFDVGQLSIHKTVDRPTVTVGEDVVYTITVENTGQIEAVGQTVTDDLPAGATFVSADPEGKVNGVTLTWTLASLAAGESVSYTVTVRYDAEGSYLNQATVTNPDGPWHPVDVIEPSTDNKSAAAAVVLVHAAADTGVPGTPTETDVPGMLGNTGVSGTLGMIALALLVLVSGVVFLNISRRKRAQL